MNISSDAVGEWIAESLTEELVGSFASYYIGMIAADLGVPSSDAGIESALKEIEKDLAEIVRILEKIADFEQLDQLTKACSNIHSSIETIENYYSMSGDNPNTERTYLQNLQNDISALDTALISSDFVQDSGVAALANWHFNNLGENTTSVCELLYVDIQRIWGLRAKAVFTINWASKIYNNPLKIDLDKLIPICLDTLSKQGKWIQKLVKTDLNKRIVKLTAEVAQIDSTNGESTGMVDSVSPFTWFGFQNPTNPITTNSVGVGYTYVIPWSMDELYGPTGSGYVLSAPMESPKLAYRLGVGYFGTEMAKADNFEPVLGLGFCALGNELCSSVALRTTAPGLPNPDKSKKHTLWKSKFGMSNKWTMLMYTESNEQGGNSIDADIFCTGICEFDEGDFLNGWGNVPYFLSDDEGVAMTPQTISTNKVEIQWSMTTYMHTMGQYWDQRLVGPNNLGEGLAFPLTGICILKRGNRLGYLAQCRIHLDLFDALLFGGATTAEGIQAYIESHK